MVVQGSFLGYSNSLLQNLAGFSDGTSANATLAGAYTNTSVPVTGTFAVQITIASSIVKNLYQGGAISTPTTFRKIGVSFGNNSLVVSQNANAVSDPGLGNGSFAGTLSFNQLAIGYNPQTLVPVNGYVRKIALYGSAMSQNQLNTLTNTAYAT